MDNMVLNIKDLKASVSETEEKILDGLNLSIGKGETHAIMGPNGGGKSTLVNVIAGKDTYEVDSGEINYFDEDLLEMEVDERAKKGIFMAFQYPSEIPGVRPWQFIKASVDSKRKFEGEKELSVREFSKIYDENIKVVGINEDLMKRSLNEGFSGGEKKRNEVFQMLMLEPQLALLDETDSGLDVDALKSVGDVVNLLAANYTPSNEGFMQCPTMMRLPPGIKFSDEGTLNGVVLFDPYRTEKYTVKFVAISTVDWQDEDIGIVRLEISFEVEGNMPTIDFDMDKFNHEQQKARDKAKSSIRLLSDIWIQYEYNELDIRTTCNHMLKELQELRKHLQKLSLIHISEPTRLLSISYALLGL